MAAPLHIRNQAMRIGESPGQAGRPGLPLGVAGTAGQWLLPLAGDRRQQLPHSLGECGGLAGRGRIGR